MVREVRGLGTGPTAEYSVDGNQPRDVCELRCELRRNGGIPRAIEVLRRNLLALFGIEIFQVFLGDLARAVLVDVLVHNADRRLRHDTERRRDDVELGGT